MIKGDFKREALNEKVLLFKIWVRLLIWLKYKGDTKSQSLIRLIYIQFMKEVYYYDTIVTVEEGKINKSKVF